MNSLSVKARWLLALNVTLLLAIGAVAASSCGRGSNAAPPSTASGNASAPPSAAFVTPEEDAAPPPMDAPLAELWARAKSKDASADDFARLARREGSAGLVERGQPALANDKPLAMAALRALAYVDDFVALPWLADVGANGADDEAGIALESAIDLAARPRRAVDPEDADELKVGCDHLLSIAKDTSTKRARRILAIRSLRMLVDRGCVAQKDIPTDLDAK